MDAQLEQFRAYIRRVMEATGMKPSEIAKVSGLAPTTINRPFYQPEQQKSAPTFRTISKIVAATGVPFSGDVAAPVQLQRQPPPSTIPAPGLAAPGAGELPRDVPVRGIAACSNGEGAFQIEAGHVVDWVRRPPALAGVREAYGLYVCGDSMEPRWFHGELILVHPGRPVRPGDHVVVVMRDGPSETPYAYCKRLVRRHGGMVTVEQYNPRATRDLPEEKVIALHRVLSNNDLYL